MNNELIRTLAVRAGLISSEYNGFDRTMISQGESNFAGLIIKECIKACRKHEDIESFGVYPIRVAMVTEACRANIEKHFSLSDD